MMGTTLGTESYLFDGSKESNTTKENQGNKGDRNETLSSYSTE